MSFDYHHGRKDFSGTMGRYKVDVLYAGDPTTASTQGAGATGVTAVRVNETAGVVRMPAARFESDKRTWNVDEDGVLAARAANADLVLVDTGVGDPSYLAQGQERWLVRVAYHDLQSGGISYATVDGNAAADDEAVYPTAQEIADAIGGGESGSGDNMVWMKIYGVQVRRTGDQVLAITIDNLERPIGVQGRGEIFTSAL